MNKGKNWFLKKFIFGVYFHQVYKCVKKCYEEGRCVFKEKFRWQMVSSMRFQLCRCGMYYGMCELKGKLVGIYLRKEYKEIFLCILFCRRKSELCEHATHHCNGRLACTGQDLHCKKAFSVPELDRNQYQR